MKLLLFLVAFVSLTVGGCATVKPWQRESLAQPGMTLDATPSAAAEQHMLESREASVGGFGGAGGGCGCN
ncbi:MAG TPA: DUF4266 domain-containing protein [Polyangia bacterium]|nr:DUF4266 domain-containing protein [Polyangia bacterium]